MVAKIKTGRSLLGAINYNEHKVRLGKAELIMAQGYLRDPHVLTFDDKLGRLKDLTKRNERTKVNTLHVSLNFAIGEDLPKETLERIADEYMLGLGFGGQPYLVYRHDDAGHPHLHIVSTNIQPDGARISFHRLANRASEQSRKQVEIVFGLIQAEEQHKAQKNITPLSIEKVTYGQSETKRAMTHVVNEVLRTYKMTSLPELNAVLRSFNVTADRGARESRMYEKNGLVYWALDRRGAKIGVPIKASSIYGKPTMKNLQRRFLLNEMLRKSMKEPMKLKVDQALTAPVSKQVFEQRLQAQNIDVLLRHNEDGRLYGVTFVDHTTKVVFNGSDLGKRYSANNLAQLFAQAVSPPYPNQKTYGQNEFLPIPGPISTDAFSVHGGASFLDALYQEERQDLAAIGRLQQRKRRKKRRGNSI